METILSELPSGIAASFRPDVRVLFLHQNFPGQFLHNAAHIQRQAQHDLIAVVPDTNTRPRLIPTHTYHFDSRSVRKAVPLARPHAGQTARGAVVAQALLKLKRGGFTPGLVVGHGGRGETLFVGDVWPDTRILLHAEFFYSTTGAEAGLYPEFAGERNDLHPLQVYDRIAPFALGMTDADRGVAPTEWQASRFPPALRHKITVAHEGIRYRPGAALPNGGGAIEPGDRRAAAQ